MPTEVPRSYVQHNEPEQGTISRIQTPTHFVALVANALPQSTPEEARRLVDHATAWVWKFYDGKEPANLARELMKLEAQLVRN
jgi:hypothetical protein